MNRCSVSVTTHSSHGDRCPRQLAHKRYSGL
jgi:hypothetical protein